MTENGSTGRAQKFKGMILVGLAAGLTFVIGTVYALVAGKLGDPAFLSMVALRPIVGASSDFEMEPVPGFKKKTLFIDAAGGARVHAFLFQFPGTDKIAIINHGNAGNIANRYYLVRALHRAKCSVLLYDYEGYGLSTGKPGITECLSNSLKAYDYAKSKLGYPDNKIILLGESIGCGITTNLACKRKCAGVILVSGIGSLPAVAKNLVKFLVIFPDFFFAEPHLNNIEQVRSIHVPILFLHGQKDEVVPYQHSEKMYSNANEPKRLVLLPDCGHNDMGAHDSALFQDSLNQFIQQFK